MSAHAGYEALLAKGDWGIFSDGAHVWLCDDAIYSGTPWCSGAFAHTLPHIHKGPIRRVRPWWAPWQSPEWCVLWAQRELERRALVPRALKVIEQRIADAAEIERIVGTL